MALKEPKTSAFGISGNTVVRVIGIYSTNHRMRNLGHDDPLYRLGSVTQMLEKKLNFCGGCLCTFHFLKIFLELGTSFVALVGAFHQISIHFKFKLVNA